MIESDTRIACRDQRSGNCVSLFVPSNPTWKIRFLDLPLMLLEVGNVRVAEHRKAIRFHGKARVDGGDAGIDRLQGQPIDQIEVDAAHALRAQAVYRVRGTGHTLNAIDRLDGFARETFALPLEQAQGRSLIEDRAFGA
jgi:hypothetical protein